MRWHLEVTPDDSDARTLLGTILSWEGRYDEARAELALVLAAHPGHGDASRAAIHLERWSDHPDRAEAIATEALQTDKDSVELLVERARARAAQSDPAGALEDVTRALALDPQDADAQALKRRLDSEGRIWETSLTYTFDAFSDGRADWHEGVLSGKRQFSWGSLFARYYLGSHFGEVANQFELEAYSSLRPGTYLDLSAAISPTATVYPGYRLAGDIYQSLPLGFEASIGYRHLQFSGTGVDMFVGSLSKYLWGQFVTLRSFVTPDVSGSSVSASLAVRHYFADDIAYVGIRYGYGLSKDEIYSVNDTALLDSHTLAWEAFALLIDRFELGARFSVSYQAQANLPALWQYELSVNTGVRF